MNILEQLNTVDCGGQGTKEWFANRLGMLTSSRIAGAVTKRKRNPDVELQARADLRIELAVERITLKPQEHFMSDYMETGIQEEPLARAAYELRTGKSVTQVDFVLHPDRDGLEWAGCSPDGICGDELIEIKVPKMTTHCEYLLGEKVPDMYVPQMMWQMACCPEVKANVFISYCQQFDEPLDLFICRLERNEEMIAAMEIEAVKFLAEVQTMVEKLKGGLEGQLRKSMAVAQ